MPAVCTYSVADSAVALPWAVLVGNAGHALALWRTFCFHPCLLCYVSKNSKQGSCMLGIPALHV